MRSPFFSLFLFLLAPILPAQNPPQPPPADTTQAVVAAKANDDFESGTLANWKVDRSGAGNWFVFTSGKTAPDPSQSDPDIPFDVPNPPQGKFAAVTDMNGPGRRILFRDVRLDGRYNLRLTVFYVNAAAFSPADGNTIGTDHSIGSISSRPRRQSRRWPRSTCSPRFSGRSPTIQLAASQPS